MYHNGEGVPKNRAEAVKWYLKAAEQGYVEAQGWLGWKYTLGDGVQKNDRHAEKWYHKAADKGGAEAQLHIGEMYYWGRFVPKNYVLAYMWFSLSAASGIEPAIHSRNTAFKHLTPAQMVEAQKLAREWWANHPKKK